MNQEGEALLVDHCQFAEDTARLDRLYDAVSDLDINLPFEHNEHVFPGFPGGEHSVPRLVDFRALFAPKQIDGVQCMLPNRWMCGIGK